MLELVLLVGHGENLELDILHQLELPLFRRESCHGGGRGRVGNEVTGPGEGVSQNRGPSERRKHGVEFWGDRLPEE